MAKTSAIDVAQYVYDRLGWVDAWKLEKLVYFAQAWHLAWDGRPLFDEKFQAWVDGPVVPELHRVNKYERESPGGTTLPGAHPDAISAESRRIIDSVIDFYGRVRTADLIELSHADSPWLIARRDLSRHAKSRRTLSESEMRRCYTEKAISCASDVPSAPATSLVAVGRADCAELVSRQLTRWSGALKLLADR